MTIQIEMRTPPASDLVVSRKVIQVRNGTSDRVSRNSSPAVGTPLEDLMILAPGAVSTPTGYDQAISAWKAGANPGARKAALETEGLARGWIDSSLTGT
jgi:hypothetical protein